MQAIYHKDDKGEWVGFFSEIPDMVAHGTSLEGAQANLFRILADKIEREKHYNFSEGEFGLIKYTKRSCTIKI